MRREDRKQPSAFKKLMSMREGKKALARIDHKSLVVATQLHRIAAVRCRVEIWRGGTRVLRLQIPRETMTFWNFIKTSKRGSIRWYGERGRKQIDRHRGRVHSDTGHFSCFSHHQMLAFVSFHRV